MIVAEGFKSGFQVYGESNGVVGIGGELEGCGGVGVELGAEFEDPGCEG